MMERWSERWSERWRERRSERWRERGGREREDGRKLKGDLKEEKDEQAKE